MSKKFAVVLVLLLSSVHVFAQESDLTVEKIMQDPLTWIGSWPQSPFWAEDGSALYFRWNPGGRFPADSVYYTTVANPEAKQLSPWDRRSMLNSFRNWRGSAGEYASDFSMKVFSSQGDIFLIDESGNRKRLTSTVQFESNPRFSSDDSGIIYEADNNLFRIDLASGLNSQYANLQSGKVPSETEPETSFLKRQQEELFGYIRERIEQNELRKESREREAAYAESLPSYFANGRRFQGLDIDPTERFLSFRLVKSADNPGTVVQNYVTEDGYSSDLNARPKVGATGSSYSFHVLDLQRDSTITVDFSTLPDALVPPLYLREQGIEEMSGDHAREFIPSGPAWSRDGTYAIVDVRTYDNKDRWIALLNPEDGSLQSLDHQHDEAWISGPGISWRDAVGWLPDNRHIYFQSEADGFSHLYLLDVTTGEKTQLTSGNFEVLSAFLSKSGTHWYLTTSEESPFVRHFYRMPLMGGPRTKLTTMEGNNEVSLSPDERTMGILFSSSNRPPEVYLQKVGSRQATRITHSPAREWLEYDWRIPEIITVPASDGVGVPARLYEPKNPNGSAVLFVHGAGYLQNVHNWWSSYFREYMLHNLLADLGYYVLDLDYRASSGYGRDWRTAVYRHMGGRDLQDYVDASRFVGKTYGVQPERVGIYGGSYGGFITLMALFTEPEHFGAGAALRSVTDWAHYNHGYTANILNTPETDSLAFARSSPINFAEGLEDPLLIAHGVIDTNVHFQDVVRLAQRLIELGKENWEMAIYPVEGHGFTEPSSWTDEYSRILKLFNETIGPKADE